MITFTHPAPTLYPHADSIFPPDAETRCYVTHSAGATPPRMPPVKDAHTRALAVRVLNWISAHPGRNRLIDVIRACGGNVPGGAHAIRMLRKAGVVRITRASRGKDRAYYVEITR